ncbi:hypothetical protein FOMPIDRAFT_1056773 [Fomitopsis schrenkii]|uniref:Uncharacterized protein n=1 Tax=Fomitopsis schrenkii TaxID=2126942 RepID=S8DHS5_FOMSC|nr:hypothetical protein FOMPIDRAFT_1056773 [Fomitopsis schrenkii]
MLVTPDGMDPNWAFDPAVWLGTAKLDDPGTVSKVLSCWNHNVKDIVPDDSATTTTDPISLSDQPSIDYDREVPSCRCDRIAHAFDECRAARTEYGEKEPQSGRSPNSEHAPNDSATTTDSFSPPDTPSIDRDREVPRCRCDHNVHAFVECRPRSENGEREPRSGGRGDEWIKPARLGAETPDARQALLEQLFREATPETGKAEIRQLLGKRPRPDKSKGDKRIGGERGGSRDERSRSPKHRKICPESTEIERLDLDCQPPGRDLDRRFSGTRSELVDSAPPPPIVADTPPPSNARSPTLCLTLPQPPTTSAGLFSRLYEDLPRTLPLSWLDDTYQA